MTDLSQSAVAARSEEWRSKLSIMVGGLLVFESLTGLAIYLLPFSLPIQFTVLVHTAAGLVFIIPYIIYQIRHWVVYRHAPMTHVKLTGYLSLIVTLICGLSGVVRTVQAALGTRISYAWELVHIISTFALIACAVPHIAALILRRRRMGDQTRQILSSSQQRWVWGTVGITAALTVVTAGWTGSYQPVVFDNSFPPDYVLAYGEDRPFAPSLATTATGGAIDGLSLGASQTCGTAGCHEQIVQEWEVSAHRWSAMDAAFQAVQNVMAEQNGAESTRYCGGCHDPISLFSGTKNIFTENLTNLIGYQEGVSCISCHAIKETDFKGNANYTMSPPERYAFELEEGDGAGSVFLRDFLIRAYPEYHVESLSHRLFKSPEFCAACHKQFIDSETNRVGWVQLQNQYDNWHKSRWNHPGDPTSTIKCRECHMPLISPSTEPGSGDALDYNRDADDGMRRSHRFLGANQFMSALLNLPGGEEQIRLTERWMRGDIEIPESAHKWTEGPVVPIELITPDEAGAGDEIALRVRITNNKAGHDFPTGPLDIIQAWVEITVTDHRGERVFETGTLDEDNFIKPGSFIFKAEPVDQYGNLIDRHNLWEMVGVHFKRSLFPGFADEAEFTFSCPSVLGTDAPIKQSLDEDVFLIVERPGSLHVTAKLQYRTIDQYLLDFLTGEDTELSTPVTTLSEASRTIRVLPPSMGMTNPASQIGQGS